MARNTGRSKPGMSRRTFVAGGAAAGAGLMLSPLARVRGANDAIRVAVIGMGGRGSMHMGWFNGQKGARLVAGVDPDRTTHGHVAKYAGAKAYTDIRKMLDDKAADVVINAAANHWHVLGSVWAIQAGCDVYCEKPVSHNIWEGRQLVNAARKHNKIVQGGTQQRSDPLQAQIRQFLAEGSLGKVQYVRLNHMAVRGSIGKRSEPLVWPKDVDKDLWLGPAADEVLYRNKLQYDWHWDWNTGNGELGNWGPHILDDCRNVAFGDRVALPRRVVAGGGRFVWNDAGNTPNTHFIYYDTGEVPVVMAVHNMAAAAKTNSPDVYERLRTRAFLVIQCEGGYYAGGRGGGSAFANDNTKDAVRKFTGDGGGAHATNFLNAVRSRKKEDLNAEIEQIHYSSAWAHLGNIAYRLGEAYNHDAAMERVKGYGPWEELVGGFEKHMAAHALDPVKAGAKLGPMLEVDAASETFTGPTATDAAKALLTREYRKGFEVPKLEA